MLRRLAVVSWVLGSTFQVADAGIYSASVHVMIASEVIVEENFDAQDGPPSRDLFVQASASFDGGSESAWARAGDRNFIRAFSSGSWDGIGNMATAAAYQTDTFAFFRDGVQIGPSDAGSVEVFYRAQGTTSVLGDADAEAGFRVVLFNTNDFFQLFDMEASIANGQSLDVLSSERIPMAALVDGRVSVDFSVFTGVVSRSSEGPIAAVANLGNSLYVWARYLDEQGIHDPTVTLQSFSGIDYSEFPTQNPVPEPSTLCISLMMLGLAGARTRGAKKKCAG